MQKKPTNPDQQPKPLKQHWPERHGSVIVSLGKEKGPGFFSVRNQLRSMAVGLVCGSIVILAFLFVLFNEMIIAPFMRPSNVTAQPTITDNMDPALAVSLPPQITIPKINLDIPLVYGAGSTDEKQFELALDQGIAHYPTTAVPGQPGNAAFFGHSSNNIFNPGKYKFAFVLLHELENGDTFSLTYNGVKYNYVVVSKKVVKPTEVSVLNPIAENPYAATLITCDPPGTSTNRLVVVGQQISPSPGGDPTVATPTPTPEDEEPASIRNLPGNGPGLLNRIWRGIFGSDE